MGKRKKRKIKPSIKHESPDPAAVETKATQDKTELSVMHISDSDLTIGESKAIISGRIVQDDPRLEIQKNQVKEKPPEFQLSDRELRWRILEMELHRKTIEHWGLRMEKFLIGLHRSRIENKIDELQLEQLLEKLDEKHRRLIATRYCYPKESWENVPLEMTQFMLSEQHRSVSIGTLQYGNENFVILDVDETQNFKLEATAVAEVMSLSYGEVHNRTTPPGRAQRYAFSFG